MKPLHLLNAALLAVALLALPGCWTDLEQYKGFECERLGGDFDGDGVCSRVDCNDYDPNVYKGAPCDDGNPDTINDTIDENCECVGQ